MRITAKYRGKCRVCGREIQVGDEIEWSREQGATHLDCVAAGKEETEKT